MDQEKTTELEVALRRAERSLKRGDAAALLWRATPAAVLASALWVALVRFTLLPLPGWPAILPVAALLAIPLFVGLTGGERRARAARFLDARWRLDQRLSTMTQFQRRLAYNPPGASPFYLDRLREEAWLALQRAERDVPWIAARPVSRSRAGALVGVMLLLLFAVAAPSPADGARQEAAALAEAVDAQLGQLANLRSQLAGAEIPEELKAALLSELEKAEQSLRTAGTDQGALLAALDDAQERIQKLGPERVPDLNALVRAAQALQDMARRAAGWQPPAGTLGELARGVLATERLDWALEQVSVPLQTTFAQEFDTLSRLVESRHKVLSNTFEEASVGLYGRDLPRVHKALLAAAAELRRLDERERSASAVESALSRLETGKESIVETAQERDKPTQLGFERGNRDGADSQNSAGGATAAAEPGEDAASIEGLSPEDLIQRRRGGQSGGMPAPQQGDSGAGVEQRPGNAPGSGGAPVSASGTPGAPSRGGQAAISDQQVPGRAEGDGRFDAPISGAPSGLGGEITKVENPEGQGTAPEGGGEKQSTGDMVYIPEAVPGIGGTGEQSSSQGPDGGRVPVGEGAARPDSGTSTDRERTPGKLSEVRTPYQEVLREYEQRAAEALERSYIPPDAKKLVRDYFANLDR